MKMIARRAAWILLSPLLVAGCSGEPALPDSSTGSAPSVAQQIEEIAGRTTNPHVAEVLEDGVVGDDEFHLLQRSFVDCMHTRGWVEFEVQADPGGLWNYVMPADESGEAMVDQEACADSSGILEVEPLYVAVLQGSEVSRPQVD